MKATADSSELVFTLRIAPDTARNASALKAVEDAVLKTHKKIQDSSSSFRTGKSALAGFGFPDERELAKASAAQLRHQQRQAEQTKAHLDKQVAAAAKAAADKAKAEKAALELTIKESKRAADEQIREAQRVERELDRQHARHRQRQLNTATRNRAAREDSISSWGDVAGTPTSWARPHEEFARRGRLGGESGRFNGGELMRGASDLGRGIAYSGLVGEKNQDKFLETLLKVEAGASIARGGASLISGMGLGAAVAPVGAFTAAVIGAGLALNGLKEQVTGEADSPTSQSGRIATGWARVAEWDWRIGSKLFGKGYKGGGPGGVGRGLAESEDRRAKQPKSEDVKKSILERMQYDEAEASAMSLKYDRASSFRHVGTRNSSEERTALDADLVDLKKQEFDLTQKINEENKRGGVEVEAMERRRDDMTLRVRQKEKEIREIRIQSGRETNSLEERRLQTVSSMATARMNRQAGLAQDAASRLRSDESRFGAMDPLEQLQVKSAAMAFRSGHATREQLQRLGGFHQFEDEIEAHQARLGRAASGGLFAPERADAATAKAELGRAVAAAEAAELNINQHREWTIKVQRDDALDVRELQQIADAAKEAQATEKAERIRMIDDITRRLNGQQRAREIIAAR